jgi:hypothetical protein
MPVRACSFPFVTRNLPSVFMSVLGAKAPIGLDVLAGDNS